MVSAYHVTPGFVSCLVLPGGKAVGLLLVPKRVPVCDWPSGSETM